MKLLNKVDFLVILISGVILVLGSFFSPYWQSLTMEILIWSLFAMSFNILYGYTGLLSFGQSLFFGTGCYSFALAIIYLKLSVLSAIAFSILITLSVGIITGFVIIRVVSHYFVILTVLFSLIPFYLANRLSRITGGDDGIPVELPSTLVNWFDLSPYDLSNMYWFICSICILVLFLIYRFLKSPLALILEGIRENELRMEFCGYKTSLYRLISWVLASGLAGLSGCLYVLAFKYSSSLYFHWTLSGESVIWTILGGAGSFMGPILGTTVLILVKDELSSNFEFYPILVSTLLIVLMHYKPSGLIGILSTFWKTMTPDKEYQISTRITPNKTFDNSLKNNAESIIETVDLGISFQGIIAIKEVNLKLSNSKIEIDYASNGIIKKFRQELDHGKLPNLAFVGPNGAGKTTLFNLLTGVHENAVGQIEIFGKKIFTQQTKVSKLELSKYEIVARGLVRTFQKVQVFPELNIENNIKIALIKESQKWQFFPKRLRSITTDNKLQEILELTKLDVERKKMANELSYGRQKMLEIAITLALDGELIILDEPTAGVSPKEINLILGIIAKISLFKTVLLIEHDMNSVRELGFTTCVLADGEIIAVGSLDDVLENEEVRKKFLST